MPTSHDLFDHVVQNMLIKAQPSDVLDIGPGAGKYGKILREIELLEKRSIEKVCIEADQKVIERFELPEIYEKVIHYNAAKLISEMPTLSGDIAILGDVIEHLPKSVGADLIEYLQYRFRHIFLVIPIDWVSFEFEDYDHESHVSIWRLDDMNRFEGAYAVERKTETGERFLLCSINI